LALLAWPTSALAAEGPAKPRVGLLAVESRGPSHFGTAWEQARLVWQDLPIELIETAAWRLQLREKDQEAGLMDEVGRLLRRGRELQLGLKMEEALVEYRQALRRLEVGYIRYYEPVRLAEVLLATGVAQHQLGRALDARKAFMRALALAPGLELAKGYYGPSVRQVFAEARIALGPLRPGVPQPVEIDRLCRASKLDAMIVAWVERMGQRSFFRLSLFDAKQGQFVAVESGFLVEAQAEQVGREQARRLQESLVKLLGLCVVESIDAGSLVAAPDAGEGVDGAGDDEDAADGGAISSSRPDGGVLSGSDAGPVWLDGLTTGPKVGDDGEAWYTKHWWIWPAAALVVGTAIALPLTVFREDVVDVQVRP